jgi:hypothetical protein
MYVKTNHLNIWDILLIHKHGLVHKYLASIPSHLHTPAFKTGVGPQGSPISGLAAERTATTA